MDDNVLSDDEQIYYVTKHCFKQVNQAIKDYTRNPSNEETIESIIIIHYIVYKVTKIISFKVYIKVILHINYIYNK